MMVGRFRVDFSRSKVLTIEHFVDFIFLASTYLFLFSIFKPSLLISDTYTTGGDMGSHMYPAWYMREYLLPHLKIFGWSMAWYAGFPMFEYYFPLPFAAVGLLSYLISFKIAFKLVTVSGVFLLPLASYLFMRLVGFKYPAPALASVFSLCLLFNEEFSIWGGNIKSTLAGQFTFIAGVSLAVLYMGLAYSYVESRRHFLKASFALAAVPLCHIYTLIWAVSSTLPLMLSKTREKTVENTNRLWSVYLMGFALSGFWSLNTISKLGWSTAFGAWRGQGIWEVVPKILIPFYPLAFATLVYFMFRPDKRVGFLASVTLPPLIFFAAIRSGITEHLLDVRFMPFVYLGILYLSAVAVARVLRSFRGVWLSSMIVLLLSIMWVTQNQTIINLSDSLIGGKMDLTSPEFFSSVGQATSFRYSGAVPSWVEWNYRGYDVLSTWPGVKMFFDYLGSLPPGRVVHEFSSSHDSFGTPRTLELIPFFSGHPVLEGLNIESAASSPFHFYMQSEYSKAATCPLSYMRCTRFNFPDAVKHFRYFAPKYVVASSDVLKEALEKDGGFRHLKSLPYDLEVYELVSEIPIVEVPKYYPVAVVSGDWREASMKWWKKPDATEVPIVLVGSANGLDEGLFGGVVDDGFKPELLPRRDVGRGCNVSYSIGEEYVDASTDCPGLPHLIKITYNPGWSVVGADRIYLAGPAFMLVYPSGGKFRLTYGSTTLGMLGYIITVSALLFSTAYVLRKTPPLAHYLTQIKSENITQGIIRAEYMAFAALEFAKKRWKSAVCVLTVILLAHLAYTYLSVKNSECSGFCRDMGYVTGRASFSGLLSSVDHFDMGYDNKAENIEHEFVCTAVCDASRGDFVYVNFGMIGFSMKSKPGVDHRLSLLVDDSHWCRTADIYFNGKYLETIRQSDDKVGWNKRSYIIPARMVVSDRSNIVLNHSASDCWGMDISDAWLEPVECTCG